MPVAILWWRALPEGAELTLTVHWLRMRRALAPRQAQAPRADAAGSALKHGSLASGYSLSLNLHDAFEAEGPMRESRFFVGGTGRFPFNGFEGWVPTLLFSGFVGPPG